MTKVLVVDDSALMRKLLGRIFSKEADFEVQFARNGLEALELLAAFRPDVVTLDIHMPQMDGLACLDRIMIERPCPVVMVSSLTAEGAEVTLQALRLGAIDFVAKPEGAISLHIDELTDELITKVRAASTARIRSSARLKERVRHRIGRDAPGIRLEEGRLEEGQPEPRSTRQPGAAACRRRRAGAGRHLDRRTAGTGSAADGPARRFSLADRCRPAHAGDLHGRPRPAAEWRVGAQRRRGRADAAAPARLRLYRQGRCRPRDRPARLGPRRRAGPLASRLPMASKHRQAR